MTFNSESDSSIFSINTYNEKDNFLMPKPVIPRIIPKYLTINSFQYTFHERQPDNQLLFKCKVDNCKGTLSVDKTELEKFTLSPNEYPNITYLLTQEHTCNVTNSMSVTEGVETINDNLNEIQEEKRPFVDKDILERAKKYILINKEKGIRWHMQNLLELNLVIPYEILEEILKEEREKKYPYDNQFLFNMDNIFINLDNKSIELRKMNFCQRLKKILNPKRDYREEKFYIFCSLYQIKHFIGSDKIFIDLNFKVCPKSFLQLMTIFGYNSTNKKFMPCFFIPMSHSTFILYDYVFKTILDLIDDYDLNFDDKNKNIILQTDIESNLINAFKNNFGNTKCFGAYFNYVKKIWKKAKKCGLFKKDVIDFTKNILFGLMIIVFLKKENFINYFNEIKEYTNQIYRKIKQYFDVFIKYFEDKIINSEFINFLNINNSIEWNLKINDVNEIYNYRLSNSLEHFFPKMAYLTRKMKDMSRYYYNNNLYNNNNNTYIKDNDVNYNIFDDLYNFMNDYFLKYKRAPNFKDLLNIDIEFHKKIEIIFIKCLKVFFGFQCKTFISNSEDEYILDKNEYNFTEMDLIIPPMIIKNNDDEDEEQKPSLNKSDKEKEEKIKQEKSSDNSMLIDENVKIDNEKKDKTERERVEDINNEKENNLIKKGKNIDTYLDYEIELNNNVSKNTNNKDNFENPIEKLYLNLIKVN